MKKIICKKCGRELPNENWITSNGCRWCDTDYHKRIVAESIFKK